MKTTVTLLEPTFNNVAVYVTKTKQEKENEAAGIIVPGEDKPHSRGTVHAVGPDVEDDIEAGVEVLFRPYGYERVSVDGEVFLVMEDKNIVAVLSKITEEVEEAAS